MFFLLLQFVLVHRNAQIGKMVFAEALVRLVAKNVRHLEIFTNKKHNYSGTPSTEQVSISNS